ncbi:hypothetical protein JL720_7713 [Aureococcus anophagefferens]|nr:hypothetical protein JL720_7713 [Aureococcus anophagefferens]
MGKLSRASARYEAEGDHERSAACDLRRVSSQLALAAVQRRVYAAPTDAEFAAIATFGPADEGRRKAAELMERAMEARGASAAAASATGDACVELARLEFQGRGGPADREAAAALCAQARAAATPPRAARLAQLDELEALARWLHSSGTVEASREEEGDTPLGIPTAAARATSCSCGEPSRGGVLLKVLDEAGSTKGLAAAAAVFIAAELLRLAIADDEPAPAPSARSRRGGGGDARAAFASNAGELYGGATSAEVQSSVASALEKRRDKRRDDAARPPRA